MQEPGTNEYRILRTLGRGMFGETKLVEKDGKQYAMKVFLQPLTENQIEQTKREVEIVKELNDENFVQYYEFAVDAVW